MRDISLTARPSETIGLVDPNGSGKSSLVRTVYRVLRPDTGQVLVDGGDAWSLPVRQLARAVAAVVQDSAADFDLAVREVVAMGRTPHKRLLAAYTPAVSKIDAVPQVSASSLAVSTAPPAAPGRAVEPRHTPPPLRTVSLPSSPGGPARSPPGSARSSSRT